jgi:simple sugar transport system ATP-binding protein
MKSSESDMTSPIIRIENITKRFPGVLANDSINFDLNRQEIHALLGENGAGKSSLMNILYGLYKQDAGRILIKNQEIEIRSPNDALAAGIGMVHQHFMLVPVMTVTENLMLGHEKTYGRLPGKLARLDRKRVGQEIRALGELYGLHVDPDALVEDLSVGEAQRVEILKVLYKGADVLILDEPTAVLTPQETSELFEIMRTLVRQGKSIIFITHKLKEVMEIAMRITVLRMGKVVGTTTPRETSTKELAAMMVGREVLLTVDKGVTQPTETVLDVENLIVHGKSNHQAVRDVSFQVRAGEVYGIAGVQGNGQTELVEAITGLKKPSGGKVSLLGQDVTGHSPRSLTRAGLAHIPEDRHKHGLILPFPIDTNLVLETYYRKPFSNGWWINLDAIRKNAEQLVREFDVRTPSIYTLVSNLSGGNQQKVIVARELSRSIKLLVINQPTRGLDVGSIEFIHKRIIEARDRGVAVLLISAELDEILSLSDRIGVMYNGQIVKELPVEQANRETLGYYMAGLHTRASG